MPSPLPLGDFAPADGTLPVSVNAGAVERDFGVYVHVPFCRVRCGYCDFNTYTAKEIRGMRQADYPETAIREIAFAREVMLRAGLPPRPVSTVFFGGGTPTLLPANLLVSILGMIRDTWGLATGAEITTEANPDSLSKDYLLTLAAHGFTRVSVGMQSAVPEVLRTLDRTHNPDAIQKVSSWTRDAGLQLSLDLIYGTPGESLNDWQHSLEVALEQEPDHISAYALIVEQGTKLARQIARGTLAFPDEDAQADAYELADELLTSAGYHWYEVSNWARGKDFLSRHNLSYWRGQDWWGIGPGAHSHLGGTRWWNVKHPAAYASRLASGVSPAAGREVLDAQTRRVERVLLETRTRAGLSTFVLDPAGRNAVAGLIAEGLVQGAKTLSGRVVLTRRGRLLADAVVRRLLG